MLSPSLSAGCHLHFYSGILWRDCDDSDSGFYLCVPRDRQLPSHVQSSADVGTWVAGSNRSPNNLQNVLYMVKHSSIWDPGQVQWFQIWKCIQITITGGTEDDEGRYHCLQYDSYPL
ncbi:unnamed protein product, partial [Staurois parvus]